MDNGRNKRIELRVETNNLRCPCTETCSNINVLSYMVNEMRYKLFVVVRPTMKEEKDIAFQLLPNEDRKVAYDLSLAVLIFTILIAIHRGNSPKAEKWPVS